MIKMKKTALTLVAAGMLLSSTAAYAHFLGYSAVDSGEIRWGSSSVFSTAISHANSQWDALGSINIAADTASTYEDVTYMDVRRSDVTWDGRYSNSAGSDEIEFNRHFMDGYTSTKQKAVATHELGHALGLAHSYSDQIMYYCSTCSGYTTPQSHDRSDYYSLW